jgi:hypothetical protein
VSRAKAIEKENTIFLGSLMIKNYFDNVFLTIGHNVYKLKDFSRRPKRHVPHPIVE